MAAPPLSDTFTIETDLFEHRTVGEDFINPCCFGRDFAAWLQSRLSHLAEFTFSEPLMEDFGWSFAATCAAGQISVALSYAHDGPVEGPATWVVSVEWQRPLNPFLRWRHRPDAAAFERLSAAMRTAFRSETAIRLEEAGDAR